MVGRTRARRALMTVAIVAALAAATAACGRGDSGASGSEASDEISIVFASSAVDANIANLVKGFNDSIAEQEKSRDADISVDVLDAGMNSDKQISQIQDAIVKKPDVIIVDPVDIGPVSAVVQQAKDAGIKVYGMRPSDSDPKGLWDGIADLSQLEAKMADNMTGWIQGRLDADPSLTENVGVIYGAAAQTTQLIRGDAVKEMAKADPDRVKIVAEKFADWSLQTAQDATADFITANDDLNLVVTANNQMGQGAVNAVTSANKSSQIEVATYDIDPATVEAVQDGKFGFATGFELYGFGQGIAEGAVQLAFDESADVFNVEVYAVTQDNAADVLSKLHS